MGTIGEASAVETEHVAPLKGAGAWVAKGLLARNGSWLQPFVENSLPVHFQDRAP
jgi:hypothetical protein